MCALIDRFYLCPNRAVIVPVKGLPSLVLVDGILEREEARKTLRRNKYVVDDRMAAPVALLLGLIGSLLFHSLDGNFLCYRFRASDKQRPTLKEIVQ